jgi:hypothetical protein
LRSSNLPNVFSYDAKEYAVYIYNRTIHNNEVKTPLVIRSQIGVNSDALVVYVRYFFQKKLEKVLGFQNGSFCSLLESFNFC